MTKAQKPQEDDQEPDFLSQIISSFESGEYQTWNEFIDTIQTQGKVDLDPVELFALASINPNIHNRGDLEATIAASYENVKRYQQEIERDLDQNDLLVHKKDQRNSRPEERYLRFIRDEKGKLKIVAFGGQSCIIEGKAELLPLEDYERLFKALRVRELEDYDKETGKPLKSFEQYTEAVETETREIIKHGTKEEKARRFKERLHQKWKEYFVKAGYSYTPTDKVAIKVFFRERNPTEAYRSYARESAAAAELTHVNILPILTQGESKSGQRFMTMPFIEKNQVILSKKVHQECTLDEIINLMIQACNSLDAAHEHGIVHRDIKPGNALIVKEDPMYRFTSLDYGLASIPEMQMYSMTEDIKGTPGYWSPEQVIDSKRATPQSDIYSLGLLFYEWISGKRYSPEKETFTDAINRLQNLVNGFTEYKALTPSSVEYNVGFYEIQRNEYRGIKGWFKKRADKKKLKKKLEALEKVIAKMIVTQNIAPFVTRLSRLPEYQKRLRTEGTQRLEYRHLNSQGEWSDKEKYMKRISELRYSTLKETKSDLQQILDGNELAVEDHRDSVFVDVEKENRNKAYKTRLKVELSVLATLTGTAIATGCVQKIAGYFINLFK